MTYFGHSKFPPPPPNETKTKLVDRNNNTDSVRKVAYMFMYIYMYTYVISEIAISYTFLGCLQSFNYRNVFSTARIIIFYICSIRKVYANIHFINVISFLE